MSCAEAARRFLFVVVVCCAGVRMTGIRTTGVRTTGQTMRSATNLWLHPKLRGCWNCIYNTPFHGCCGCGNLNWSLKNTEGGRVKPILPQQKNYLRDAPRPILEPRSRRVPPFVRATWHPLISAKLKQFPASSVHPRLIVSAGHWPLMLLCGGGPVAAM